MVEKIILGLNRSIHDPIHGTIPLSNIEMKVIESDLFKRLHYVRQNSFLYKVFPSAKHTRFEHSIGVMHIAGKILKAMYENGASAETDIANLHEINTLLDSFEGVGINLTPFFQGNWKFYKKVFTELRLAALLHDIGHGPLSHLFDAFAPTCDEYIHILQSDERLVKEDSDILNALINMTIKHKDENGEGVRIEHEHVSSYFAYRILRELKEELGKDSIRIILTILKPELDLGRVAINDGDYYFNLLPLLHDIVASAPIDCDRMDYLLRDSYFAGVPYGNYSEERILKSLLPYCTKDKSIRLGIKESGLHAVENFLQARYELYVQVYGHKTNEACNAMLNYVIQNNNKSFTEWSKIELLADDFVNLYLKTSDETFLAKLSENLNEESKKIIERINKRNLWKRVFEVEEFISTKKEKTKLQLWFEKSFKEMEQKFNAQDHQIKLIKFKGERFPLKDLTAKLLEKSTQLKYVTSSKELSSASQIIDSLNKGLRVWRVYTPEKKDVYLPKEYARINIFPQL